MRIKNLLANQAGVTLLEGVIALGLLALVSGGAFAVLLSASRSSSEPDVREEMLLAVEKANDKLKAYLAYKDLVLQDKLPTTNNSDPSLKILPSGTDDSDSLLHGLCGNDRDPLSTVGGAHDITCMLPPICDRTNPKSKFEYTVVYAEMALPYPDKETGDSPHARVELYRNAPVELYRINYHIGCNGYEL